MDVDVFLKVLDCDFFTGVPDSLLRPLCDALMMKYGRDPKHHVIAANEGNAAALAAGYYLATGRVPAVYLQNSGEGNIVNPVASLLSEKVYGIPAVFVVGWRGEPGVRDEPQHLFQGEITQKLLEVMGIPCAVLGEGTGEKELGEAMAAFREQHALGRQTAFLVRKGGLSYGKKALYANGNRMLREEVIRAILETAGEDIIVCTTGKAGRELFELRESRGEGHERDFLTVGSMGHSSSIALGIALQQPRRKVWCIDGDGALLMHMGAMAVIGQARPRNLVHVLINNEAHESVGGAPTAAGGIDFLKLAESLGYDGRASVASPETLGAALREAKGAGSLFFLEAKCAMGARKDLGRPWVMPRESARALMRTLQDFDF